MDETPTSPESAADGVADAPTPQGPATVPSAEVPNAEVPNAEVPNAEVPNGGALLGAGSPPAPASEPPPSAAAAPGLGAVVPPPPPTGAAGWTAPPPPPPDDASRASARSRGNQQRNLGVVAAIFLLVGSAFVGFGARDGWFTRNTSSTSIAASPSSSASTVDNSNSSSTSNGLNSDSITQAVDPALVNITSITGDGVGAGTGMIISSKGLVLTNHHVISGAETVQVEVGGNGKMYDAHVVGYSIADDVALVQIEGISGLPTISTSNDVAPNDDVLVLGNALGRGGEPHVSPGQIVALNQSITATDETGSSAERLTGMIQINAPVQPGQSGGAVVNANGDVVGMTTAASVNGGFRFGFNDGSNEAYAIPIARALSAAKEIQGGSSTASVHVGPRAVLGVTVPVQSQATTGGRTTTSGVQISGATTESAQNAGLTAGSTIIAIGDQSVSSVDDITKAMNQLKPDDKVKVTWLDTSGNQHSATVQLSEGPPA